MASLVTGAGAGAQALFPLGVLALALVALAIAALYLRFKVHGDANCSGQCTGANEAKLFDVARGKEEALDTSAQIAQSANDDCVAGSLSWGSDSEDFTPSELLLPTGVYGDLTPADSARLLCCVESPLPQHRLARTAPHGVSSRTPLGAALGPTPDAGSASPPLPLAPVPPYSSFIKYRTWFAKLPGYDPSQLTPGWQERLRLLLIALNGDGADGACTGGGRGDGADAAAPAGEAAQQPCEGSRDLQHGTRRRREDAVAADVAAVAARAGSPQGQQPRRRAAASQAAAAAAVAASGRPPRPRSVRVAGMYVREGCIELLLEEELEDWQREWEWGSGLSTESEPEANRSAEAVEAPPPRLLLLPPDAELQLAAAAPPPQASPPPQAGEPQAGCWCSGVGAVADVGTAGAGAAGEGSNADRLFPGFDISRWLAAAAAAPSGSCSQSAGGNSGNSQCSNGTEGNTASSTSVPRRLLAGFLPDAAPVAASVDDDTGPVDANLDRRLPVAQALSVGALAQRGWEQEQEQEQAVGEAEGPFLLRGHLAGSAAGDADRTRTLVAVGVSRAAAGAAGSSGGGGGGAGGGGGEAVLNESELIAAIVTALVGQRDEADRRRRQQERQPLPPVPPAVVAPSGATTAGGAAEGAQAWAVAGPVAPPPRVSPAAAAELLAGCPLGAVTVGPRVLLVAPPPLPSLLAAQVQQRPAPAGPQGGRHPSSELQPQSASPSSAPPLLPLPRAHSASSLPLRQRLRLACYPVRRRPVAAVGAAAAAAALVPAAARPAELDTRGLQVHVRSRGAYLRCGVSWLQATGARGGDVVAAAAAGRGGRPQVAEMELQEPHLQPGVAMLDVRWCGVPCAAVPLVLTSDPALARELAMAAAAWPRSAEELDALLLDFGTWEFYVADMSAMAAALAEAAAAEAPAPLPRMPPPAPLVVTLGRHLLGYATAAGWRRVAARLRADLSWMGLGEVVAEVAAAERPVTGAGQAPAHAADAAEPGPAQPCGDVSPGADTEGGAQLEVPGEVTGAAPAGLGLRGGRGKGTLAAADGAHDGGVTCESGNSAAAAAGSAGAGISRVCAGADQSLNDCDGGHKGTAGAEVGVEEEARAFHRFADAVALQQGHMRYFDVACMLLLGLRTLAQADTAAASSSTATAPPPPAAGSVLLVLVVSTFAGVLSMLARPLLSAPGWEVLERRCRLLRYYCYAAAKAMVFAGVGSPPGVSAYLLTPGMLLLEGVMVSWGSAVRPREGMLALLAMNLATFAQIAQKLSHERNGAAAGDGILSVFSDRAAVVSAALVAGRTLLAGVATNLVFNAYVRRLYNRRR
ncbi:hypothetical protein HXX76_006612 [Chlamydomonas incerta]|uniref:Uncharacterized protein n=1 Tax=Chlamydomonas incerta TaxID=51695 RepID=A0A835W5B2_CHLIN|nr:hypothetical protein HXX76_006612 [Chlamydomonas incerta]|eukprot:KAG2436301.1 hypothetical protein HXX76_006612 [Chlamydomonas incerta]